MINENEVLSQVKFLLFKYLISRFLIPFEKNRKHIPDFESITRFVRLEVFRMFRNYTGYLKPQVLKFVNLLLA